MIQFKIDSRITSKVSEINLSDEWTVRCARATDWCIYYINVSIKTHRIITTETISISGALSISNVNKQVQDRKKFSKSMNGFQLVNLVDLKLGKTCYLGDLHLFGEIIISLNDDKCTNVVKNKEGQNCIQPKSLVQLSNDLERLLDPQTTCFADVNLVCGTVSIPAHKMILSARSPVFAAMFKNPMKESHENRVDITDIDASVLQTMMIYIYAGKTSNLTVSSAVYLLVAADKYQLLELKDICSDFLKNNATLQNVLRILVLGDLHAEDLKLFAMDYISEKCTNFSAFEKTEEWVTLKKERPALAMEVLASLVKSRDKK